MIVFLRRPAFCKETLLNIKSLSRYNKEILVTAFRRRKIAAADILIRFGNTAVFPAKFQINTPAAIHLAANKRIFRQMCQKNGISVPKTWDCTNAISVDKFPVIIRPPYHSQGKSLIFIENKVEFENFLHRNSFNKFYVSEYIHKSKEFRIYVVNNRIVAVAEKIVENPDTVAWNRALGSTFDNTRWKLWPRKACFVAIKAMNMIGLDIGAVDVILDEKRNPYLLEINTAFSIHSNYRTKLFAQSIDLLIDEIKKSRFHKNEMPEEALRKYMSHSILTQQKEDT